MIELVDTQLEFSKLKQNDFKKENTKMLFHIIVS